MEECNYQQRVSGPGIRLYLDENINIHLTDALSQRGYDVIHALREGNVRLPDEQHLRYAASLGRAIVTHNFADFVRLHRDFLRRDEHHGGIILVPVCPLAELATRLSKHLDDYSATVQRDNLLWA